MSILFDVVWVLVLLIALCAMGMFGVRYDQAQAAWLVEYHPTFHQVYVERFRSILHAAGISEAGEVALVTRLNLSVDSALGGGRGRSQHRHQGPG